MNITVPFFPLINKQLKMLGSFRYGSGDYELAISFVERGLINLKPIMTQQYEFDDALEAFEATKKGKDAKGKVGPAVASHEHPSTKTAYGWDWGATLIPLQTVIKCVINGPK